MTSIVDTMIVTHDECGYTGTIAAVQVHSCYVQEQGGRCEDYPCCGHTDGDGCQTLPSHTADFYYRNPHLLHEPGSPEWYDALDDMNQYEYEPPIGFDMCKGCGEEKPTGEFDGYRVGRGETCLACRIRDFVVGDGRYVHWKVRARTVRESKPHRR